jgi:hypothetical protein
MNYKLWLGVAGLLASAAGSVSAQEIVLSAGAEYATGDYGGGADSELLYVPFSAGLQSNGWLFNASLPWISLSGPGILLGDDVPLVRGGEVTRGSATAVDDEDVSGFGDLTLSLTRTIDLDRDARWQMDLTGRVKFPVASVSDGLSTGETDYALGADLIRNFETWSVFAGAGYRLNGDPPGFEIGDTLFASAGFSQFRDSGATLGAALDFSEAVIAGLDDQLELSGWVSWPFGTSVTLQLYSFAGLTDGGPDAGAGLRFTRRQ